MYSKKESVPPGSSRPVITAKIRRTSSTAKLFNGSPETMRSYFCAAGKSSTGQCSTRVRSATAWKAGSV